MQAIDLFLIFSGLGRQNKISTRRLIPPATQARNIENIIRTCFRQKRNRFATLLKLHLQKKFTNEGMLTGLPRIEVFF